MACGPLFLGPPRSLGAPARSWRRSCRFPHPGRAPMRQERASTPHAPASARTACTRTSKAQNAPADLATARPCERSTASRSPSSDCSSMADPSRHARAAAAPRSVAIARRSARDVSTSTSMEHVCRPMESEFEPRHGRHGLVKRRGDELNATRCCHPEAKAEGPHGCRGFAAGVGSFASLRMTARLGCDPDGAAPVTPRRGRLAGIRCRGCGW